MQETCSYREKKHNRELTLNEEKILMFLQVSGQQGVEGEGLVSAEASLLKPSGSFVFVFVFI